MTELSQLSLVRPAQEHMPDYIAALERGWSADNLRGAAAARDELEQIKRDPAAFLALMHDPEGLGPPVTLPDGTQRKRIPGLRRWMWDNTGFVGTTGLRWTADGSPLPPHVLGNIGYAVVPWRQRRGHATRALGLMLAVAREQGLNEVEITTDPDNLGSQKVILSNGGVLVETFDKGEPHGHVPGLRYRIGLGVTPWVGIPPAGPSASMNRRL